MQLDEREADRQYKEVLSERLRRLETIAEQLKGERQKIDDRLAEIGSELVHLRALVDDSTRDQQPEFTSRRMATPTDVVRLLEQVGGALHYRKIEGLLREQGFDTGGGADPANGLLARYYDDPRLYRPSRGTYDLRSRAPGRSIRSVGQRRKARS